MFKFLKKKIKETVKSFSDEASEQAEEVDANNLGEDAIEKLAAEPDHEDGKDPAGKDSAKDSEKESQQEQTSEKSSSETSEKQDRSEQSKSDAKKATAKHQKQDAHVSESEATVAKDADEQGTAPKKGFLGGVFSRKKQDEKNVHSEAEQTSQASAGTDDHKIATHAKGKADAQSEPSAVEQRTIEKDKPSSSAQEKDSQAQVAKRERDEKASPERKEAVHKDLLESETADATRKKQGLFSKIKGSVTKFQLTEEKFEELFWEFELALLENNVAVDVIDKIKKDLREKLTSENVSRRGVEGVILDTLKASLEDILDIEPVDLINRIREKKPYIISVIGVNGSGKTTTIGKLIRLFQNNDLSVVVAAADTFRAAAIQQLEEHTTNLGVTLIKQDYQSDAAAVAFDAINHAKAKDIDVVLIDTAGRLQSNKNLMDELSKLIRVNKPDFNLFIGESITGNDCVEQAKQFEEAVGIDGIILSKADIDDKGGAALSVSYVTGKPILYLGTGQGYDDLEPFDKRAILGHIGL